MFKKRLITISAISFVSALLLGSSLIISKKPEKVSATNETHEHDDWTGVTELPTEAGNYNIYLTDNIILSSTWTVPEGTTNLCLNGHNIKITVPDDYGISITVGATLNLFDCDTHYQFFEPDIDGLWSLLAEQDVPTDYAINGGCIMGATVGGVYCSGTFNMYGGNIVGNKAAVGGGVNNIGTFNMYGGNISGNLATDSGGGVYTASNAVSILTGGTITQNTAPNGAGVYYKTGACFVAGTQITMADGSKKAIEELAVGDSVRVFDHNNGNISSSNLFDVGAMFEQQSGVVNLHFTSDIDLSVVYGHSFFDREANKYVPVTKDTVSNYVGHQFYNVDNACWETLTGYDFVDGEVDTYIIASEYNLNCVANGMLSVEDGFYTALSNTFEFGDNLTIDANKKAQDIEKYGIYGFENIIYMNKHTYDALGLENLNVTVGKGLFSKDYFEYLAMILSEVDPEIYCDIEELEPMSKSLPRRTRTETPVSAPTAAGLYVGGSIQIIGNEEQNLYLPSDAMVIIGTGTVGTGNGVPTPTEAMSIGLTLQSGIGAFTASGVEDYSENFFSDSEKYVVRFNDKGDEDVSNDYLELSKHDQQITFGTIYKLYDGYQISITEWYKGAPNNYFKRLGEGEVTIEYKVGGADDSTYTTEAPKDLGNYVVRVSVAEDESYLAGSATKEFSIISKVPIQKVAFNDIAQPVAGETAQTTVSGLAFGAKYSGTLTWSKPIPDDGEYECGVTYTATITLTINKSEEDNFEFADNVTVVKPSLDTSGWKLSNESTSTQLIFTKTFETTESHDIKHHEAVAPTCTEDGTVEYWTCSRDEGVYYANAQGTEILSSIVDPKCHKVSLVEGLDPTYENDGYKAAYKCSTCGEYFEDEARTHLIGDEAAYNAWKANAGHLDKLVKETEEPAKSNTGLIVGLTVGGFFLLLLIIYLLGYFFFYRKGKLDEKKIKVIYKFLPRCNKNLKENEK